MRDFKSLKIWQRAHALAIALHQRTRDFGRETIEIRKMTYTYRRKVVETAQNE